MIGGVSRRVFLLLIVVLVLGGMSTCADIIARIG